MTPFTYEEIATATEATRAVAQQANAMFLAVERRWRPDEDRRPDTRLTGSCWTTCTQ